MNVINNTEEDTQHLIEWFNSQKLNLNQDQNQIYSLNAIWQSQTILNILTEINSENFQSQDYHSFEPQILLPKLDHYLQKNLGKRVRKSLQNKIAVSPPSFESLQIGLELILYICLHSDHKNKSEFINRILHLSPDTQTKIMSSVQKISKQLDNIVQLNQMLERITELQNQNQNIKKQIQYFTNKEIESQAYICELQQDNKQLLQQIKQLKKQKQKIYSQLKISGMDDYSIIYRKIQNQNIIMMDYIYQLQKKNTNLDQSYKDLQKSFGDRSMVIAELSEQIMRIKERYNMLKDQKCYDQILQNDMSQSFGGPLGNRLQNNNQTTAKKSQKQSLLDISDINNKRDRFPNFSQWCLDPDSNKQNAVLKPSTSNQQLQTQNTQLRKYNGDLMQKLQDTYKTVQTLTTDGSLLREKIMKIQKENKFYKKQLKLLKQLNLEFQRRYVSGQL